MTQNKTLCDSEQNRTCLILRHFGWQGGTWTQVHEKLLSLKIKGYINQLDYLLISEWEFLRLLDKLNTLGYKL